MTNNFNVVEFPDLKAIEVEAGYWLIRLDSDSTPGEETIAELSAWLGRSPAHREALFELAEMWCKMNVLTELSVPLGRSEIKSNSLLLQNHFSKLFSFRPVSFAVLTCCVLAIVIGIGNWFQTDPMLESNGLYSTQIGEQLSKTLVDGSIVLLNTDSEIIVDYRRGFRDIRLLKGEAAFDVAKNPERPFRVFAGNERVQAVGTAFTVYLQENKIDITVTEGRVALATLNEPPLAANNSRSVRNEAVQALQIAPPNDEYIETLNTLIAGQSARIQVQDFNVVASPSSIIDTIETVAEQDIARRLSWREGLLIFAGDPLEDVVREISRYTTISIEITDPTVKAIKIGGQFPVGETETLLEVLELTFGLQVTRLSDDHVLLSANVQ